MAPERRPALNTEDRSEYHGGKALPGHLWIVGPPGGSAGIARPGGISPGVVSAVFAGVVVAISFNLVLAVMGIGIGLTTIDPAQGDSPQAATLGIGATIW